MKLLTEEIFDDSGRVIYHKHGKTWWKDEYDERGNLIRHETSDGYWRIAEYDSQNRITGWETSAGFWEKDITYDKNGIKTYSEHSRYGKCGVGLRIYVEK